MRFCYSERVSGDLGGEIHLLDLPRLEEKRADTYRTGLDDALPAPRPRDVVSDKRWEGTEYCRER